jgi:hypothetical protein
VQPILNHVESRTVVLSVLNFNVLPRYVTGVVIFNCRYTMQSECLCNLQFIVPGNVLQMEGDKIKINTRLYVRKVEVNVPAYPRRLQGSTRAPEGRQR